MQLALFRLQTLFRKRYTVNPNFTENNYEHQNHLRYRRHGHTFELEDHSVFMVIWVTLSDLISFRWLLVTIWNWGCCNIKKSIIYCMYLLGICIFMTTILTLASLLVASYGRILWKIRTYTHKKEKNRKTRNIVATFLENKAGVLVRNS